MGLFTPGFSFTDNSILIWIEKTNELNKYEFHDGQFSKKKENIILSKKWSQAHYKYTVSSGKTYVTQIGRLINQAVLAIYDEKLELTDEHVCEGQLIGVVDEKWLIFDNCYRISEEGKGTHIIVREIGNLQKVQRLAINKPFDEKDWPKACGHSDGRIAVVFRKQAKLYIFDNAGE